MQWRNIRQRRGREHVRTGGTTLNKGVKVCVVKVGMHCSDANHFRTENLIPLAAEKNHLTQGSDFFLGRPTPND